MLTNQTKKLVVSVLFSFLTVAATAGAPERYSKETTDALMLHYYPQYVNKQTAPVVHTEEVIPAPAEPTPEPVEPEIVEPKPVEIVKPVEKPATPEVAHSPEEAEAEDEDLDLTPLTPKTWKQSAVEKAKAVFEKSKSLLNKPGTKAATAALTVCTYLALRKIKSALAQHSDKSGTEKLKAVYNSLKTAGFSKVLQSTKQSLAQDTSVKQAFVGLAVDSIIEFATKALFGLAQTKSA